MAEETEKPELPIDDPVPAPPKPPRKLRKRKFTFDKDEVALYIGEIVPRDIGDRSMRTSRRIARHIKLMGWNGPQDYPWADASQVWLGIMLIANLKTRGTLENSLKAIRPIMEAHAKQRRNAGREDSIDKLLDYEFFVENQGNSIIDNFVGNFVSDEAVYGFVQWVKETQTYHDVRILPGLIPEVDHIPQYLQGIKTMFGEQCNAVMKKPDDGYEWEVDFTDEEQQPKKAKVCFYDSDDGKVEAHIVVDMTTHNGPCVRIPDFEDVIYPARSANLQPPTSANPEGAPYVGLLTRVNLNTIRARMNDKTYDQMSEDDFDKVKADGAPVMTGDDSEREKEQKDRMEGVQITLKDGREERQQVIWFGRMDVDGDGLEEDVIVWEFLKSKVIAKVALLTEIYPGVPIRRPFAHESFIPIPNRVCGISQDELLESLQDAMQKAIDQHMNWGEITNTPMFFYRASSGMKNEPIYLEPGMGYPLDDPGNDVFFPTWPTKDSAFAINTITLLQQFVQDVRGFSDVTTSGRIPAGKASAMRTASTVQSLFAAADLRSEQVLRRVFTAFAAIFSIMHGLNKRFLPDKKEIRVVGMSEGGEDAYMSINREDLQSDVDFEFKATLINTNKQALSAALSEIIAMALTPLAFQAGLIDLDSMYTLLRDKTKALDLDPDKYWKRPPEAISGPPLLAEEVLSTIVAGEIPHGKPLEAHMEHLQKLMELSKAYLTMFSPDQLSMLDAWINTVKMQMIKQQQLLAVMGGMQGDAGGNQPPGGQGVPGEVGVGANPAVRGPELLDESVSGEVPQ